MTTLTLPLTPTTISSFIVSLYKAVDLQIRPVYLHLRCATSDFLGKQETFKHGGELMGVDMTKAALMLATMNVHRQLTFRHLSKDLPTLMPKDTVLNVLKILVDIKSSELGFIIGEILINMVVRGEVTTFKGFEEISSIIITEMISENLQKFKYSYDLKNTIKICLISLELQIICYLTFSVETNCL
ncbi:hypothetical protein Bca101_026005 [Brassica carinata]